MQVTEFPRINKIALGLKFKELRETKQLTQEEVAVHFKWQKQVLSDVETGKALSLEKCILLSDFYGASLDELKNLALCN